MYHAVVTDPRTAFEQLTATWKVYLEDAYSNVSNEDADYWREQAARKIRGPVRRWLADVLLRFRVADLAAFLKRLPPGWQESTELLFSTSQTWLSFVPTGQPEIHLEVPSAEQLAKNNVWQRWQDEFSAVTGQELRAPYHRHWRATWKTVAAGAVASVAAVLAVARWRR